MNYIEYMQQPAGPITPALQLFNIPNQSAPEEVRQRLGMNSLAYKQLQDKAKQEAIRKYNEKRLSRDEVANIIDPKTGKLQRVYNPGAGSLSGTDPLIKTVVDVTPVGDAELLMEAADAIKHKNIKTAATLATIALLPNLPGMNASGKTAAKTASEKQITKELLPTYAHPNTDPKLALLLTQHRLAKGGSQKLKQSIEEATVDQQKKWTGLNFFGQTNSTKFYDNFDNIVEQPLELHSSSEAVQSLKPGASGEDLGSAIPQQVAWVYTDAPSTPGTVTKAHEFSHYYHTPVDLPEGLNYNYLNSLSQQYGKDVTKYFTNLNGTEIAARGNQLKNYFGLQAGEEITPEMWEYAKTHYVKDVGLDNNMTDFFNIVEEDKLPLFLKWLNKNSPIVIPAIITADIATSKPSQDKTAKQILKDGGNFLKHFPLKEIQRYRRLTPGNYTTPKIFKS